MKNIINQGDLSQDEIDALADIGQTVLEFVHIRLGDQVNKIKQNRRDKVIDALESADPVVKAKVISDLGLDPSFNVKLNNEEN